MNEGLMAMVATDRENHQLDGRNSSDWEWNRNSLIIRHTQQQSKAHTLDKFLSNTHTRGHSIYLFQDGVCFERLSLFLSYKRSLWNFKRTDGFEDLYMERAIIPPDGFQARFHQRFMGLMLYGMNSDKKFASRGTVQRPLKPFIVVCSRKDTRQFINLKEITELVKFVAAQTGAEYAFVDFDLIPVMDGNAIFS